MTACSLPTFSPLRAPAVWSSSATTRTTPPLTCTACSPAARPVGTPGCSTRVATPTTPRPSPAPAATWSPTAPWRAPPTAASLAPSRRSWSGRLAACSPCSVTAPPPPCPRSTATTRHPLVTWTPQSTCCPWHRTAWMPTRLRTRMPTTSSATSPSPPRTRTSRAP